MELYLRTMIISLIYIPIRDEEEPVPLDDCFVLIGTYETSRYNNQWPIYYFMLMLDKSTQKPGEIVSSTKPIDLEHSTPMQEMTDAVRLYELIDYVVEGLDLSSEECRTLQFYVKAKSYDPVFDSNVRGLYMLPYEIGHFIVKEKQVTDI